MTDLEARFAELEKRVTRLVSDNTELRTRAAGLERELERARAEVREFQSLQGKRVHLRDKIEKVLQSLEAIGEKGP